MEYYDKTGRKTTEEKATYKVQTEDKLVYKHFKDCLRVAKTAPHLQSSPIEWAVQQNRNCYGASVAGWVQH